MIKTAGSSQKKLQTCSQKLRCSSSLDECSSFDIILYASLFIYFCHKERDPETEGKVAVFGSYHRHNSLFFGANVLMRTLWAPLNWRPFYLNQISGFESPSHFFLSTYQAVLEEGNSIMGTATCRNRRPCNFSSAFKNLLFFLFYKTSPFLVFLASRLSNMSSFNISLLAF